ncbi:PREDICTED: 28S ribosomal protein S21, mitochondrial [Mandrillus leucophaeus]|uniref:28S ribosomal protein S21, mitochondrial n=2 Tax=Cercopithecinae TaxID=9528 RepID=UPI0005F539AA|nr:PREDICTED: 28S ribosomal protein S21, mitochondrial [Mandrillus leucophaeus]
MGLTFSEAEGLRLHERARNVFRGNLKSQLVFCFVRCRVQARGRAAAKRGHKGRCYGFHARRLPQPVSLRGAGDCVVSASSSEEASLYRILTMDGLIEDIKRRRYYEKPCRRRQRESYERCRRIYNMEMARKINFLMRKNRADPWQGC